jgi:hypothetical protein
MAEAAPSEGEFDLRGLADGELIEQVTTTCTTA